MSRSPLDANSLEILATVVAEGSFAAAARRLHLTRAAVSRRVVAIEEGLGNPLFQRSTRTLAMTDFGRAIYVEARTVLEATKAARLAAKQASSGLSGTLRLSSNTLFGHCCLVPLIAKFRAEHRAVNFDLQLTDRSVDIAAEGIDIAFRITTTPPLDYVATQILSFTIGAYAAPSVAADFNRKHRAPTPADFESVGCLIVGHDRAHLDIQWIDPGSTRHVIESRPAVQSQDLMALIAIARAGTGIVITPDFSVAKAVAEGALLPLLSGWRVELPFGDAVLALTPPARYSGEKAKQFLSFVRQELGDIQTN